MTVLAFDTHEFVKRLKDAGFSEEQAEVLTDLQKTTAFNTLEQARHDYGLDEIASKRDLKGVETALKRDLIDFPRVTHKIYLHLI
jgi:arginine repressor